MSKEFKLAVEIIATIIIFIVFLGANIWGLSKILLEYDVVLERTTQRYEYCVEIEVNNAGTFFASVFSDNHFSTVSGVLRAANMLNDDKVCLENEGCIVEFPRENIMNMKMQVNDITGKSNNTDIILTMLLAIDLIGIGVLLLIARALD